MTAAPRIAVVDYGAGTLRSVAKALERSGFAPDVTRDPSAVMQANAVVLPGAGAFGEAAAKLAAAGLDDAVRESISRGRPYLGLCLGLQLLFESSDEHGESQGLGVLPGKVRHFPASDPEGGALKVPHIGWNQVRFSGSHPMLAGLPDEDCYYFVHSYRAEPTREEDTVGRAGYGGEFTAAVARDSVFAVQFHPEKSQGAGRRLLDVFAQWVKTCG
jgi:glutamine amidotransferase